MSLVEDLDADLKDEVLDTQVGRLSLTDFKGVEMTFFLAYLARAKGTDHFDFIYDIVSYEGFLKFLDLFSGATIKVPNRDFMVKLVDYIKIYTYLKKHFPKDITEDPQSQELPEELVDDASKLFDRRKNSIRRIYQKVRDVLSRPREDV